MTTPEPRLTLAHLGTAARALEGVLAAERYADPVIMTAVVGAASLRADPARAAEQNDQLLFGERFAVLKTEAGWSFGQALRDGYVGWIETRDLGPAQAPPTHWVMAVGSIALAEPDLRAPARMPVPLNALVRVERHQERFAFVAGAGWIPSRHLAAFDAYERDPAAVAERHLGAPYLWGGRDRAGIDCSGLVQQAFFACGRGCPRDSDQQARLGRPVAAEALRRNDLVCWPGHIGMMVDDRRLVHASGTQMSVVVEPLAAAVAARLSSAGPQTSYRRLADL